MHVFGVQFSQPWQQILLPAWFALLVVCLIATLVAGHRLVREQEALGCFGSDAAP